MLQSLYTNPLFFFIWISALLVAITIHEFAHAVAADKLGDPTPRIQGRLTLNPLAHLDPVGTIALILFKFGWGKPVQFDPYNLANPKRDSAIISFAGPMANLILAAALAVFIRLGVGVIILEPFVFLNVILAIFNLVPIHPLDGGKILVGLIRDERKSREIDAFLHQYGLFLLIGLLLPVWRGSSPIISIISPIVNFILSLLLPGAFTV